MPLTPTETMMPLAIVHESGPQLIVEALGRSASSVSPLNTVAKPWAFTTSIVRLMIAPVAVDGRSVNSVRSISRVSPAANRPLFVLGGSGNSSRESNARCGSPNMTTPPCPFNLVKFAPSAVL